MPKINVLRSLTLLEVDEKGITQEAKELLMSYLLFYVDTDTELQEDLFNVEEWEVVLKASNVPLNAPGTEVLTALQKVCKEHSATYIRLVIM
ncbi:hypothetical protein [Chitinophaga tropicalis]|uniref:Uncharacterized protein n=1 Tax=Chitinophaga tropicalis TaxID=2683588 RepID=A0A7K1UEX1_9BACT|nr:hypothetical protein [Chitinophaga tropicalis]MVT12525.1 hypothetical protein [Chitinophaga tropicalis]